MTLRTVPWAVGDGAELDAELLRTVSWAFTRGSEGVIGSGSMKVLPTAVPSGQVQVVAGAATLINKSPNASFESYAAASKGAADLVTIAPTGSGSGRSDLIILRVEDPQFSPWPALPDAQKAVGPYNFYRVLPGVPNTTETLADLAGVSGFGSLDYPAIALARIDIPANTATITAPMIHDVRDLALPRSRTKSRRFSNTTTFPTSGTYVTWPNTWPVAVAAWANTVDVRVHFSGMIAEVAQFLGYCRLVLSYGGTSITTEETGIDQNVPGGDPSRGGWLVADTLVVPPPLRGRLCTATLQTRRSGGTGTMRMDSSSLLVADLLFSETVE